MDIYYLDRIFWFEAGRMTAQQALPASTRMPTACTSIMSIESSSPCLFRFNNNQ